MPCIRRLILCAILPILPILPALLVLPATPGWAQSLASTDLLTIQAPPGSPPAASSPAQPGTPQITPPAQFSPGQSFPSRGGGYQCERSRPTS